MNTLIVQDLLADPEWSDVLTIEDRRGLTPLFWAHVLLSGLLAELGSASAAELSADLRLPW